MTKRPNILLTPGPATTTDTVKGALLAPDTCPREKQFTDVMTEVCQGLKTIAGADEKETCILFCGSGTSVMDAVVNSAVPPGKKVLVINNGAYGERLAHIAKAYGIALVELNYPWTAPPDVSEISRYLKQDPRITHVAMVHHETTSGLLNPLDEIGRVVHTHDRQLILDAISSFGGIPMDIKKDRIDYLIGTANKCLQGMAGVSFVICNKARLEATAGYPPRSFYLNLYQQYAYVQRHGEMRFTPPAQVVYALQQAILEFFQEGAHHRHQRYRQNNRLLRGGLQKIGFKLLLDEALQSPFLTTVMEPKDSAYSFQALHDALLHKGFTIYPGKIGNQDTFRVANIGAIGTDEIQAFLDALHESLIELHIDVKRMPQ